MSFENVIVASVIIAAGLLTTVIPLIIGAIKKRRAIKPAEYFPPKGASPLDILIQYYGASAEPREIFNPLMLYWAERGFITIEEDCRRGLKLTKVKDLVRPDSSDGFDGGSFEIEEQLFACLFGANKKVFYTLTALSGFKEFYEKITVACKARANKITDEKSKGIKLASIITSFITAVAVVMIIGISMQNNLLIASVFPLVAMAFPKGILSIPETGLPKGSSWRYLLIPFFLTFGGVPFALIISLVPLEAALLLTAAFLVCVLNVFILSDKIDIRTNKQLKYYARICGFKKFLLLAEVRQLEELVEDDPRYYYNILPYCYVLKITKKLKSKFDHIALDGPAWYLGELRETLMF